MKKLLCVVLIISVMVLQLTPVFAVEMEDEAAKTILSELPEVECVAFLKSAGVEMPDDYEDELIWGPFAKRIIKQVEENPDCRFSYNYDVTQSFAEAIKKAVNEYYGVNETQTREARSQFGARATTAVLRDSTVIGMWSELCLGYNCYGYAIDVFGKINPGFTQSDVQFAIGSTIGRMADWVVADLVELGHINVESSTTMPDVNNLCTNERVICIRKGTEDFHFMRLDSSEWRHKPGNTQLLRYNYIPSYVRVWTNECVFQDVVYSASTTYDSLIYYISFDAAHTYGYRNSYSSSLGNTHTRYCTTCGDEFGVAMKCTYEPGSNVCRICGYPKTTIVNAISNQFFLMISEEQHAMA